MPTRRQAEKQSPRDSSRAIWSLKVSACLEKGRVIISRHRTTRHFEDAFALAWAGFVTLIVAC